MATENIVLLLFAAGLGALHLIGGPLSGVWRGESKSKRIAGGRRTRVRS